jgi:cyclophilin family peptidyl-prolyl cis-trans isomerase
MTCRPIFKAIALLFLLLCGAGIAGAATVKRPAQPTNLTVKALGVNSFLLKWKDNASNEVGWEIRVALKGKKPQRFLLLPTANITAYTLVLGNELPGKELDFQLAAYNYNGATEQLSKVTPIVTVKALSPSTFGAPSKFTATAIDDSRIRLVWKDNATSEHGYQLEYRPSSSKKWLAMPTAQPGKSFKMVVAGFSPATAYQFRVRAFKGNPVKFTAHAEVAKTKTLPFQPPTDLVATSESDGKVSFKWKNRSSLEAGFEIEFKTGTANFAPVGTVPANSTSADPVQFQFNTDYSFRMRAYRFEGTTRITSGYSNTVVLKSSLPAKPTALAGTATSDSAVNLTWKDASVRETGYEILYREVGAPTFSSAMAGANAQAFTVTNLSSAITYEFRVSAVVNGFFGNRVATSDYQTVQVRTKDGVTGDLSPLLSIGVPFSYQIQLTNTDLLTGVNVTGLPDDLTYNPTTRTISGTVDHDGTFVVTITATFSDGTTSVRTLNVRTTTPPVITAPFESQTVAVGGSSVVPVTGKFSDPDTASAARFGTTSGQFDIIFFPTAAPQTVDNFIDYMDAGEYDNMFFHRAPTDFVVQGGGYKYTAEAGFSKVTPFAPVQNEPGISNLRGTVAMAKIGGQPNSATSEWFVNLKDNSGPPPALDTQNGGFTVFGRVPAAGMVVIDKIKNLPIGNYDIPVGAETVSLEDVPMDATSAPEVLDPEKLVRIVSAGPAPILTYEVVSQHPATATASVTGTDITITGVATGSTTIKVKATDLDGNSVTQNIPVTIP